MKKLAAVVLMAFALALIVLPAVNTSTEAASTFRLVKDPGGGGR